MQRQPVRVAQQVVLRSRLGSIGGVRTGQLTPLVARTPKPRRCSPATSRHPTVGQLVEHELVQPVPHAGVAPLPQPPPSGVPRTEPELGRQVAPATSSDQDEQDPSRAYRPGTRGRPPGPRAAGHGGSSGSSSAQSRSSTSRPRRGSNPRRHDPRRSTTPAPADGSDTLQGSETKSWQVIEPDRHPGSAELAKPVTGRRGGHRNLRGQTEGRGRGCGRAQAGRSPVPPVVGTDVCWCPPGRTGPAASRRLSRAAAATACGVIPNSW